MTRRRLALLLLTAALASCAASEPSSDGPALLERRIPRAICVYVRCEGDEVETWGPEEEWREDLVAVLGDQLRVGEVVFHSEARDPPPDEADLRLDIVVQPISPRQAEWDAPAATLGILAYVTIPLLPLWIRDVHKDPGLSLTLTAALVGESGGPAWRRENLPVPDLLTSFSERVPFLSWTMLGAIVVPPCVFKGEERSAHMESSMGERVRRGAADQVAKWLSEQKIEPELLRDFEVRPGPKGWLLSFMVEPEVGRLVIRLGSKKVNPRINRTLELGRVRAKRYKYQLPPGFEGRVHIEATSLETSGIVRCYTLRIPNLVPSNEGLP